jgi:hypothetical protein
MTLDSTNRDNSRPSRWQTVHFAFVTLWSGRAHAERTLDWLATADMPPNSALYWVDNSGGGFTARLRADWQDRLRSRFLRLAFVRGGDPYRKRPGARVTDPARHVHIAQLCNRIFPRVSEEVFISLDDDVVPPLDGVRTLHDLLESSDDVAMVAGAMRDRVDPRRVVAACHKEYWLDIPQYDALPAEPFEIGMAGGGFMMLSNRVLQQVLPVRCQKFANGYSLGWDGNVCRDITALGYRMLLHPGVRCAHFCPEVLAYEATLRG